MPERQTPVMRAPTTSERLRDTLRKLYEGASEQPLGQIADALGLSDLQGMADQESGDQPNTGLMLGMAGRKVPVPQVVPKMGGAGGRIKPSGQSGLDQALKVPRFRSEHGTFVKHEGEWWRLPKQPGDAPTMKLQRLEKLHEMEGEGMKPRVLEERTVNVDDFYKGVLEAKGTVEPGSAGPRRQALAPIPLTAPATSSAPVLAGVRNSGNGVIYMEFDRAGTAMTPAQLESTLSRPGARVTATEFKADGSLQPHLRKFRLDVWDANGNASSKAAAEVEKLLPGNFNDWQRPLDAITGGNHTFSRPMKNVTPKRRK